MLLCCLVVKEASSRAIKRASTVTVRAESFKRGCMVITGALSGEALREIRRPATRLPHASRLRGLITAGLFSLIGGIEINRGVPMETKNTTRKL